MVGPRAGLDVLEKTKITYRCSKLTFQLNMDCHACISTCINYTDISICIYTSLYASFYTYTEGVYSCIFYSKLLCYTDRWWLLVNEPWGSTKCGIFIAS